MEDNIIDISHYWNSYKYDFTKPQKKDNPLISFCMPIHDNSSAEINASINSLLNQEFSDWELIIWDNSEKTDNAETIGRNASQYDNRIRYIKSSTPLGWAFSFAYIINNGIMKGRYFAYLGAADIMPQGCLPEISAYLIKYDPDVFINGVSYAVRLDDGRYKYLGLSAAPETGMWTADDNRVHMIRYIMQNTYYNSAQHYLKHDFMIKHDINFGEPYYRDCATMSAALTFADSILFWHGNGNVILQKSSQTGDRYTLGTLPSLVMQWKMALVALDADTSPDINDMIYIARRIGRNFNACLDSLLKCDKVADKYMNFIEPSRDVVMNELNTFINDEFFKSLLEVCGKEIEGTILNKINEFYSIN